MTYYHIKKYLKEKGFTEGQADYVRGMVRSLVSAEVEGAIRVHEREVVKQSQEDATRALQNAQENAARVSAQMSCSHPIKWRNGLFCILCRAQVPTVFEQQQKINAELDAKSLRVKCTHPLNSRFGGICSICCEIVEFSL